ncbi:MAG: tetratricopeptide repeat protein [Kofleriaceae bacterium]|nr:tetratricopeptide repeat protein [Myxococcales bacterium]MCB9561443.1 tetratricopeptide repeat protein [Kofleriaceae bacterium]MCB9573498.1 tetratricopeptide repeat protein [Kofleriaceae bacterium]
MTELYSIRDVARIFALQESRLRYWMQTGFVGPTVRKGGRFFYTFQDLISVKAAKDLLAAGLSMQKVRKNLAALREALPDDASPAARLRICSDGDTIVAIADDVAFEPPTRQVVMAFNLPGLAGQVAEVMALPERGAAGTPAAGVATTGADAVPTAVEDDPTEANGGLTAYRCFVDACAAEDAGALDDAEHLYRQAIDLQPSLAAAQTNLGNLLYRRGDVAAARALYEQALEHEPNQAEARYNLGNLLEDLGETELAIAELRRVTLAVPDFADAHYNLGLMLARVGGVAQAARHLERYLELDTGSEWSERARGYLTTLAA